MYLNDFIYIILKKLVKKFKIKEYDNNFKIHLSYIIFLLIEFKDKRISIFLFIKSGEETFLDYNLIYIIF